MLINWKMNYPFQKGEPICFAESDTSLFTVQIYFLKKSWWDDRVRDRFKAVISFPGSGRKAVERVLCDLESAQEQAEYEVESGLKNYATEIENRLIPDLIRTKDKIRELAKEHGFDK